MLIYATELKLALTSQALPSTTRVNSHFVFIFLFSIRRFIGVSIDPLPHIKCIRLGSVRSMHLPFKMHEVGYVHPSLPILMHVGSIATPLF